MELNVDEFFDVWRVFRPEGTREECEREWAEFQEFKAAEQKRRQTQ